MTTTSAPPIPGRQAARTYHLISADSHVNEPPDVWIRSDADLPP